MLRRSQREDIAAIQRIRMAVRENRLGSTVIGDEDVFHALEVTGRGWVVEVDGEVVGFGIANRETRNIWALFIDPDHEGNGHGRLILDAMTHWLWKSGDGPIWLSTDPGTRAERFYATAGWTPAGTMPNGEVRFEKLNPG
ncbi:MAG: GNAT family N-acetyltransferase [Xanthomonadales bacterium]|nr:GNAT family N-acetyltransferase [Xanthomonadales bacterium]